ncbi:hypothetical protein ACIQPR_20730 [Streptomyces sp. NPDC091280]|uniref:hypothetical protein n=1 Tax=unclassified Streptomyces TaxID=2593676 RepID=UPI00381C83C8
MTVLVGGAGTSALAGAAPDRPSSGPSSHRQLVAEAPKSLWNGTGSECEACSQK